MNKRIAWFGSLLVYYAQTTAVRNDALNEQAVQILDFARGGLLFSYDSRHIFLWMFPYADDQDIQCINGGWLCQ